MMARPPPTRPHIGINPSHRFSSYSTFEWAEDDAWDSASDSESHSKSSNTNSSRTTVKPSTIVATTPPQPIPQKAGRGSSGSSSSFSYTQVQVPSPSSDPSQHEPHSFKNGWTIISEEGEPVEPVDNDGLGNSRQTQTKTLNRKDNAEGVVESGLAKLKLGVDSVRQDALHIVEDPLYRVRRQKPSGDSEASTSNANGNSAQLKRMLSVKSNRRRKFIDCLTAEDVSIAELRKHAWSGIPEEIRPIAWKLLLGYLPLPSLMRSSTLARKREEYASLVELSFARGKEGLDQQIWHQIEIDVPRTRPGVRLWMNGCTQKCLERILYVWAIRHPASGYVQGINDLVTPFFQVFLSAYIDSDPEEFDPSLLPEPVLKAVEADSFWCLSRLLDGIQDNYISAQPGIQRSVKRMADLVERIDAPLAAHLKSENVEFMQFAFRWMNCLLMREISVRNTIRMWDTYLAEGPDAFSQFHLYVCSAFLINWSKKLQEMDFQGIIMFLQSLPTQNWNDHDIEILLSQAFVLNSTWQNAQSHFSGK